jgi:hypothetical protein
LILISRPVMSNSFLKSDAGCHSGVYACYNRYMCAIIHWVISVKDAFGESGRIRMKNGNK